jgi:hypothetical protein
MRPVFVRTLGTPHALQDGRHDSQAARSPINGDEASPKEIDADVQDHPVGEAQDCLKGADRRSSGRQAPQDVLLKQPESLLGPEMDEDREATTRDCDLRDPHLGLLGGGVAFQRKPTVAAASTR